MHDHTHTTASLPASSRWRASAALTLTLVFAASLLGGCVTTAQGQRLQRDILALQAQFDELRSEKERLKETIAKASAEIEKLETANGQATELLRRNSADFGVQIDELRIIISQLRGQIEALQHEVAQSKRTPAPAAAPAAPPAPAPLPSEKGELYTYAYEQHSGGKHAEARRAFKEYVSRYPKDRKADDALFFWGESFFQERLHAEAVQVLQRVLTDYSGSDKVDDTLFRIGEIFEQLGKCDNAQAFFEELLDKHAKSPLVKKTRRKLRTLKRKCR